MNQSVWRYAQTPSKLPRCLMEEGIILCWNIRRLNNDTNRANVKHTIFKNQTNIICLRETKCSDFSHIMKNDIWGSEDHGWAIQ